MIALRTQLLRDADALFALAPIDPVWRNQREASADTQLTAEEIFSAYLDELLDDDDALPGPAAGSARRQVAAANAQGSIANDGVRYVFDDVLRQAIAAEDYSPLG